MKTALYRHFDADGVLLYIGISRELPSRTRAHCRTSEWAQQTATIRVEWYNSQEAASNAERAAIRAERPIHNKTYSRPSTYPRLGWDGVVAHPELLAEMIAFCEANGLPRSRFGSGAIKDANLIRDVENGRELRRTTREAIRDFMSVGASA